MSPQPVSLPDDITEGYTIIQDPDTLTLSIKCGRCEMESYSPKDVEHRYCGYCCAFHAVKGSESPKTE